MSKTISFRLPGGLARRVVKHTGYWLTDSESDTFRRIIEEWVRLQEHPGIRFVDGPTGRRASLVDGADVWEVIVIARSFDFDAARIASAYPRLTTDRIAVARAYYEAYPEEVDVWIEGNARAAEALERELERLGV